jgi:hypothetical protein
VPAPADIAERLGRAPGENVVVRRQQFYVDDEPMQLSDGYYPADIAAGTPIEQPSPIREGSLAVVEAQDGPARRRVTQFVEDLDIRMPTPGESATLNIPPASQSSGYCAPPTTTTGPPSKSSTPSCPPTGTYSATSSTSREHAAQPGHRRGPAIPGRAQTASGTTSRHHDPGTMSNALPNNPYLDL